MLESQIKQGQEVEFHIGKLQVQEGHEVDSVSQDGEMSDFGRQRKQEEVASSKPEKAFEPAERPYKRIGTSLELNTDFFSYAVVIELKLEYVLVVIF